MSDSVLTYERASALIAAALAVAKAQGLAGAAAVVDAGGHLVAFGRLDGASFLAADVTRRKAVTAAALGVPTKALAAFGAADPAVGADLLKQPDLCAVGGGVPVRAGGRVVGGLGFAGGRADQDHAVAEAAVATA